MNDKNNTLFVDDRGWIRGALDGKSVIHDFVTIPRDKVYSKQNRVRGFVGHSIVGTEAGALARFGCTERDSDGSYTDYCSASACFTNPQFGVPTQHFPIDVGTWTSGGRTIGGVRVGSEANTNLVAMESGGGWKTVGFDQPFTSGQHKWAVAIIVVILAYKNLKPKFAPGVKSFNNYFGEDSRFQTQQNWPDNVTLFNHNQWANTQCPSTRYDAVFAEVEEIMAGVSQEEFDRTLVAMYAGSEEYTMVRGQRVLKPFDTRLKLAKWRRDQAADGKAQSMGDRAESAIAVIQEHQVDHPDGGDEYDYSTLSRRGHSHRTESYTVREASHPTGPDIDPE